jgi:hypothetical protein
MAVGVGIPGARRSAIADLVRIAEAVGPNSHLGPAHHLPEMAYDSPIHRYLLTFTYSYAVSPPAIWRNGEELIILEAPHPWGTVLVRRAPTRVRTLQRLRAGHPDQVDQP